MGQQPIKKKEITEQVFAHIFQSDPRLTQQILFIPQLFSGPADFEIKYVERLQDSLPPHKMEVELIDGINERFTLRTENQQKQNNPQSKDKKKKDNANKINMYELGNVDLFLGVLRKIQQNYQTQKELDKLVRTQNIGKKITVRKKVVINYISRLDKVLYARGYLHFYLILLRKNLTSRDSHKKQVVSSFHKDIGRMICQMIEHDHLVQQKMLQLFYKMVIVEKQSGGGRFQQQLNEIKDQFWPLYLKKQHSLTLNPAICEEKRQISRCYLDQLYLRSIKQAQDPDIIVQTNEGLGIIRNFPILRVKDKNR